MRYGFYVSGNAGCLKKFLRSDFHFGDIAFIMIDNTDNRELPILCEALHIPFFEYSYKAEGLKGKEQNRFISDKLLELMNSTSSDYCFAMGGRILVGDVLTEYENRLINIHPAILPSYKGLYPIDRALEDKALLLGNTAHFVVGDVDSGPVIMQNLVLRKDYLDYDTVLDMQIPMFMQIVLWLRQGRIELNGGEVSVKDAVYEIGRFIPRLELELGKDF